MPNNNIKAVLLIEELGISFNHPLIREALTHPSLKQSATDASYERLEFLGDAVLGLVIAEYLFKRYPYFDSGRLSRAKSHFVSEESLAQVARELQLGSLILMGKGEEKGGGREKPSVLSDAFEAVVGAIYLIGGLGKARKFIMKAFKPLLKSMTGIFLKDYKSLLQEYVQSQNKPLPQYVLVKANGLPHDRVFTVQVKIEGEVYGEGMGKTKKEAGMIAAKKALEKLGILNDTNENYE
ncbi:ribonuclease III [bacterium]|nr:ribonuclease III [bacterium]